MFKFYSLAMSPGILKQWMENKTSGRNAGLQYSPSDPRAVDQPVLIKMPLTPACPWAAGAAPLYRFGLLFLWTVSEFEPWGCWSSSPQWRPGAGSAETHRQELMQLLMLFTINNATQQCARSEKKKKKTEHTQSILVLSWVTWVTCPGLGLVAALLGKPSGSDWGTELSLLARSRGCECREGRGSVWALSLLPRTYFGDSKKGTCDGSFEVNGFI